MVKSTVKFEMERVTRLGALYLPDRTVVTVFPFEGFEFPGNSVLYFKGLSELIL